MMQRGLRLSLSVRRFLSVRAAFALLPSLLLLPLAAHAQSADSDAPTVTGVAVTTAPHMGGDTWAPRDVVEFTVTFSEAVQVAADAPPPALELRVGDRTRTALYARASGETGLVFSYEVMGGDSGDSGDIWLSSRAFRNAASVTDLTNNPFAGTLPTSLMAGMADGNAAETPVHVFIGRYRLGGVLEGALLIDRKVGHELSESTNTSYLSEPVNGATYFEVYPIFTEEGLEVYLRGLRLAPTSEVTLSELYDRPQDLSTCTNEFVGGDGSGQAALSGVNGRFPLSEHFSEPIDEKDVVAAK